MRFSIEKLMRKHSLSLKTLLLSCLLSIGLLFSSLASAEVIHIPVKRTISTQPITSLEIIAIVKTLLNGRVLSIKKQASYSNPDCHYVKLLEDKGEFQMIKLACFIDNIAQTDKK